VHQDQIDKLSQNYSSRQEENKQAENNAQEQRCPVDIRVGFSKDNTNINIET